MWALFCFQVLDNLPHDKVAIVPAEAEGTGEASRWKWMQTVVVGDGVDEPFVEEMRYCPRQELRNSLKAEGSRVGSVFLLPGRFPTHSSAAHCACSPPLSLRLTPTGPAVATIPLVGGVSLALPFLVLA